MILLGRGPTSTALDGRDTILGPAIVPAVATYGYVLPNDTVPLPPAAGGKSIMLGCVQGPAVGIFLGPTVLPGAAILGARLPSDTVPTPQAAGGKSIALGYVLLPSGNRGLIRGVVEVGTRPFAVRGIFTWTGRAAILGRGRGTAAQTGVLVVTGRSVTIARGIGLTAAGGSVVLAGHTAICRVARGVAAGAGLFALTGRSAGMVATTLILSARTGVVAVAGSAAGLARGRVLHAAIGLIGLNTPGSTFGTIFSRGRDTQLYHQSADGDYYIASGETIMAVQVDILEGSSASHHITQGWAITRVAVITGLNADASADTAKLYNDALTALIAVVGDRGSQCPSISVPTYLEEFIPELLSPESVKIRIVYKGYPLPTYEFNAGLSQVESNVDAQGHPITVAYTYPDDYALDPRKAGLTITQGGMVSRPVSEPAFTIRFLVTSGTIPTQVINGVFFNFPGVRTATEIMTYLAAYEGTVNSNYYQIGLISGAPHQWMVTSVRGVSRDGGDSYEASMTFQFRAATWDQLVTYINPDDGKPPPDLEEGVGYKMARVPAEASFPTFNFGPN